MTEVSIVQWAIEPLFSFGNGVSFTVDDQPNATIINNSHHDILNASLVTLELKNNSEGNLTSRLYVRANHSVFGKRVYCGNGITEQDNAPSILIKKRCKFTLIFACIMC